MIELTFVHATSRMSAPMVMIVVNARIISFLSSGGGVCKATTSAERAMPTRAAESGSV